MKKLLKIMVYISAVASCVNIIWLILSYYEISNVYTWINGSSFEFIMKVLFYGVFASLLSHIIVFSSLIGCLKTEDRMIKSGGLLLLLGMLSFVSLYLNWAGLIDIINEFPKGFEINFEISGVKVAIVIQSAMYVYSTIYFLKLLRIPYSPMPKSTSLNLQT